MKNIRVIFSAALCMVLAVSCFKEPKVQGYLGENIRLQGGDTLATAIGVKTSTATAFLDNSTTPGVFKIEKVRDRNDQNVEAFFRPFDTNVWNTAYDHLVDTTLAQVQEKLTLVPMTPLMINEVNGQLYTMESTAQIGIEPGDIFKVDVSYTNSKGTAYIEDYAVLKFEAGESVKDFSLEDMVNGIALLNQGNENLFPLYDQINSGVDGFADLRENLFEGKTVKGMTIKKIGEKQIGVELWIQFFDEAGNLFDPAGYGRYTTTDSFINYGLDRVNRTSPKEGDPAEAFGMGISFPYTPWPVYSGTFYSYIRSAQFENFEYLDIEKLKADFKKNNESGKTASWPADLIGADKKPVWPDDGYFTGKWYTRFRCAVKFEQPGIYLIKVEIPYVSAVNKNGKN